MLKLLVTSIWHYRRISVVVILAVAISTAVIGGSLIVGDSIRFSLKRMTQQRLGQITHIMRSGVFFRQDLSTEIQNNLPATASLEPTSGLQNTVVAPAILLTGSLEIEKSKDELLRIGSVSVVGITTQGWNLLDHGSFPAAKERSVVLGHRTAKELNAKVGDTVSLWMEIPSSIPRDSLLGERSEVTTELVLEVAAVLPHDVGASRFDVNPGQQLPFNVFVDLVTVQERLGLEEVEISRRNKVAKPARINTLLAGYSSTTAAPESAAKPNRETAAARQAATDANMKKLDGINDLVSQHINLKDLGVTIRKSQAQSFLSVETDSMVLDDSISNAVHTAASALNLESAASVIYLLNEIYAADRTNPDERYSMYSIVAGINPNQASPLGPFRPSNANADTDFQLADDEILLTDWLANDLQVTVGDSVSATWHAVGSNGDLPEIERTFKVAGILTDDDGFQIDSGLTPLVEGVTDVEDFGDIRQPFEMDMDRLTDSDDNYWEKYKAAPKAFLSLENAAEIWKSRYGKYTSIRVASQTANDDLDTLQTKLEAQIQQNLQPQKQGLSFRPVRAEGLQAAVGANNFSQLFLGFSFFLILSAIILASLMFRLGIQQRIRQMGLMSAVGWSDKTIRKTFLIEGLLLAIIGSAVGCVFAVAFAKLMVYALTTIWIGAVGTKDLVVDIQIPALVIAFATSVILAGIVIRTSLKAFGRISLRDQLAGNADAADHALPLHQANQAKPSAMSRLRSGVGPASVVLAITMPVVSLLGLLPSGEAFGGLSWQMVGFFIAGFACLNAGLYALKLVLNRQPATSSAQTMGLTGLWSLAFANAARNPTRSLLTCSLIAFATFVIVAVAAGRRNPLSEVPDKASGNGGFRYVVESASGILFDLNSKSGLEQLGLTDQQQQDVLETEIYSCSMKPGSDASCVNLYQTHIPTMLGIPDRLIERGGFRFADTAGTNPWTLLKTELPPTEVADGAATIPTIPVMGDMNTLMYSLKKGMGSTIMYPNEAEPEFGLQVIGLLDGSVFQGVLLLSEQNLKRVDTDIVGSRYFLVEASETSNVASVLESSLNDFGVDSESVNDRITAFLAVQNTYLSTFQLLGALGLLVGTFGLAAVMVRNIIERQREISLMKAVGFSNRRISRLIISENMLLLLWGIGLGTAAALLAMLPHLKSTGGDLQWLTLLTILAAIAITGAIASVFAVRTAANLEIRNHLAAE